MKRYVLSPSILAADFTRLGKEMEKAQQGGAQYLHFDVMDGLFVPSISFGMPVLSSVRKATNQILDVHLMIQEPVRYVDAFQKAGADLLTIHYEACEDVKATITEIHKAGMKCGLALCPDTPVSVLEDYLTEIEMVLIMTVHPGFGGQKFIPASLDKLRELKALMQKKEVEVDVQVDGGIYHNNVRDVLDAGANVIVAGSAVFKGDITENVKTFMEILKEYE